MGSILNALMAHQGFGLILCFALLASLGMSDCKNQILRRKLHRDWVWKGVKFTVKLFDQIFWTALFLLLLRWDLLAVILLVPLIVLLNKVYAGVLYLIHFHVFRNVIGFVVALLVEAMVRPHITVDAHRHFAILLGGCWFALVGMTMVAVISLALRLKPLPPPSNKPRANLSRLAKPLSWWGMLKILFTLFSYEVCAEYFCGGGAFLESLVSRFVGLIRKQER